MAKAVRRKPTAAPYARIEDAALIAPPLLLIAAAVLDFGATWAQPAVFFATLSCAWAAGLSLMHMREGQTLRFTPLQAAAGIAFAFTLAWALFTLTPYGPFSVDQAWRLVGGPGALTLDKGATLIEVLKLASLGAMVFTGLVLARYERRAERTINALLIGGALYALWAIVSFAQNSQLVMGVEKTYHVLRLTGSFMSANSAASLFGVLACIAWISGLRNLRAHLRHGELDLTLSRPLVGAGVRFALAGLFWVALLLTVSRAAMAATILCLVVITAVEIIEFLLRQRAGAGKILAYTFPAALSMVVVFTATIGQQFIGQFSSLSEDRSVREAIFATYLQTARDAPISGMGLGSFRALNGTLIAPENFQMFWSLGSAHNVFLQWALEGGVIGFSLMALTLALLLADVARRRVAGRSGRSRASIALAASAVLLIHNAVDYSIQVPAIAMLWALLLGLGAGAASSAQPRPTSARWRHPTLGMGADSNTSSMASRPAGSSTRAAISSTA
ncbi:MAG: O-antigen ligase family protein [Phenylobacterium sp.]|uniref:O-antigen ligase family protein n=1 Tax=Phenylobacterium sp. TaxID=1871053 RepID=UPI0027333EF3|nr:O-antigen ligase family protein [Phenylobacterium sp.]MDP3175125.1 O-antigen ligase family protein [Phenylobacterium sp.]